MTVSSFHVRDMHCASCESRIANALHELPGIEKVRANAVRRELFVDHDQEKIAVLDIFGQIEKLGFTPMLEASGDTGNHRQDIKRLGIAGLAMMQVMMQSIALYIGAYQDMSSAHVSLLQWASFIFCLPVIAYSAQPFFNNAWHSIRSIKRPQHVLTSLSMDVPVSLALIIAFSSSVLTLVNGHGEVYFDSVVMFAFLLLIARFLNNSLQHGMKGTSALSLLPNKCTVMRNEKDVTIDTKALRKGDRVLVRPGERIVADGVVLSGTARVDEALLSGESDMIVRGAGETVTAGTTNFDQAFEFEVKRTGPQCRLAQIENLASIALSERTPSVLRSNVMASYFVFAMLLVALSTLLFWIYYDASQALAATIAVLVVSCPCALALATPAAVTAALTKLQSCGVAVSDGSVIEQAANIGGVALDKTGTLTTGRLTVANSELLGQLSEQECLRLAAGLERASNHPVARAFHRDDKERVSEVEITPDGVSGNSPFGKARIGKKEFCCKGQYAEPQKNSGRSIWLSVDANPVARFELSEQIRPDVNLIIDSFNQEGIATVLLSGDRAENCQDFSAKLPVFAALSPEQKSKQLCAFRDNHGPVLMLGDGINDLPALAAADLAGVVLESPDAVKSMADVLLLSRQLGPVYQLLRTARQTRRVIRQNMIWAVAYNITMVPLAASGVLVPWMAALGMSLSSILVMLNSTRISKTVQ